MGSNSHEKERNKRPHTQVERALEECAHSHDPRAAVLDALAVLRAMAAGIGPQANQQRLRLVEERFVTDT
jgi:hypothetical protein